MPVIESLPGGTVPPMAAAHSVSEDYSDIEDFILRWTAAGTSIHLMRPFIPRWRRQLLENGVERVSVFNTLASDLMIASIQNATPGQCQDKKAMHEHRNLLYAVGAPMLRGRGWKP
jgi:hypothetical protein